MQPKPGDSVIVTALPAAFLDNLPSGDQQAITAVIGKPILLKEYDDEGRAELEFTDDKGGIHFIYVNPSLIRNLNAHEVLGKYNEENLPDFCEPLTDVNQVGTFGNRPIHLACYRGNMADVVALVEGGADVNAVGDLGSTPLPGAPPFAVFEGWVRAAATPLTAGFRLDNQRPHFSHQPRAIGHLAS